MEKWGRVGPKPEGALRCGGGTCGHLPVGGGHLRHSGRFQPECLEHAPVRKSDRVGPGSWWL